MSMQVTDNRRRDSAAARQLAEANIGLAYWCAGRVGNPGRVPLEDLQQEAFVALQTAAGVWDSSRGFKFSTYATKAVMRHLFKVTHRAARVREQGAETMDAFPGSTFDLTFLGCSVDLDILPEHQRFVIVRLFGLEGQAARTLQAVGDELGLTKERIRQIKCRAIRRLRRWTQRRKLEYRHAV